ncbi:hypothetical protein D3C73_1125430 [compost metagenome]
MDVEVVAHVDLCRQVLPDPIQLLGQFQHPGFGLHQFFFELHDGPVGIGIVLGRGLFDQVGDTDVAGHAHDRVDAFACGSTLPDTGGVVSVQSQGDAAAQ